MSKKEKTLEEKFKSLEKFTADPTNNFYPSGSVIFDALLGGGIPEGVFLEIASDSGLGKSTMVLHFCRIVCSLGKKVVYMDFEKGVNESQLKGMGLDPYLGDLFLWYQPVTHEDAEEIIDTLAYEDDLVYIVTDSVTSMLPGSAETSSVSDLQPGLKSRYDASYLRKYKSVAKNSGVTFIFINQTRVKFNFNFSSGSSKTPAGGSAQQFYMDIRVQLKAKKRLSKITQTVEGEKKIPYGIEVEVWAIKNRYERPFIPLLMTIIFGKGISNLTAYKMWLENNEVITKSGSWYSIEFDGQEVEDSPIQGQSKVNEWIKDNVDYVKDYIQQNGGFILLKGDDND